MESYAFISTLLSDFPSGKVLLFKKRYVDEGNNSIMMDLHVMGHFHEVYQHEVIVTWIKEAE